MSKVVEFLQANPVQYLATVGRDGKASAAVHVLGRDGRQAVVLHEQHLRTFTRICRQTRRLKSRFPARSTHGFACTARLFSRTTWLPRRCASQIRSSRASTARRPTRSSRCSISRMHTAASLISPEIRRISFNSCRETTVLPTRGTDRGPFQSRPKVPIQKLSPSISKKTEAHVHGFLAFAEQMLLNMRCGVRV